MAKFNWKKTIKRVGMSSLITASCLLYPSIVKAETYNSNWLVIEIDQGPYSDVLQASQLFSTALSYYYDGNLRYAAIAFQKSLEYDPSMAKAHYLLGNTYYQLGRLQSAMTEYQKALALDPVLTKARINMGAVLADQGNYSEAVTEYETALELEPNNPIASFNLGVALVQLEQREQGIVSLNNAKEILYQSGYKRQAEAVEKYIQCSVVPSISKIDKSKTSACK